MIESKKPDTKQKEETTPKQPAETASTSKTPSKETASTRELDNRMMNLVKNDDFVKNMVINGSTDKQNGIMEIESRLNKAMTDFLFQL